MQKGLLRVSGVARSNWERVLRLTRDPKSVWAPMPNLVSVGVGGLFVHLASLPLNSSVECRFANAPSGSPSLSLKTSSNFTLTSMDLRMNGMTVDCIRAFTVRGYALCACLGHARASSFATLMNSILSRVPIASVATCPLALYLGEYWLP